MRRKVAAGFAAQGAELIETADHVLAALTDTETSQGILAVIEHQPLPLNPQSTFILIADGLRDPGNLGTGRYKTTEKHVSLNVAKLVGKYITETYPDVKVIYTRDDDRFIEFQRVLQLQGQLD